MKLDREKLTPEMIIEMRCVLIQGGVDPTRMTDDQVIEKFEHLAEAVVEFGKKAQAIVSPIAKFMEEFAKLPSVQALHKVQSELKLASQVR